MTLTQEKLQLILKSRPYRFFSVLESTNDEGLKWLRQGAIDGSLVIADHQTSGRGRVDKGWYTPPASAITCSLILRCCLNAAQQSTMLAAVAVFDLLQELAIKDIGIKWPNDVQIGKYKICGILSEALWSGGRFCGVVLGIGLNVRADFAGTPLANTAISLESVSQLSYDRSCLLQCLLDKIDRWRPYLGTSTLFQTWRARLISLGRPVTIGAFSGIASAVDESGGLWLELDDGSQKRMLAGTLQEWRNPD